MILDTVYKAITLLFYIFTKNNIKQTFTSQNIQQNFRN